MHTVIRIKHLFYVVALGCLLTLSGCTKFEVNTQDLMKPPTLTQEQAEIQRALTLAVGSADLKYKYPQNGDYHSSFIFYNVDEDPEDEALVFYQSTSKGSGTWINVLDRQENGTWVSVCETSAPKEEASVDFVSFENLTDSNIVNIVVGWVDNRNSKKVYVYSYEEGKLTSIFDQVYTELVLTDLDNNGNKDMVILSVESYQTNVFLSCRTEEGFSQVHSLTLERDVISFAKITVGKIAVGISGKKQTALFLDANITDRYGNLYLVTDVISAQSKTSESPTLINLLDSQDSSSQDPALQNPALSQQTLRLQEEVFCRDADGDGLIEIPTIQTLPGHNSADYEGEQIYLTTYNTLKDGKLLPKLSGVFNRAHRYMITFPKKWIDKVTVVSQPENGEWTFVKFQENLSDTSVPLLRIRVYSTKDYHDKFENDYFKLIAKKGLFEYYASTPSTTDPLGITQADLIGSDTKSGMFSFVE